VVGKIPWRQTVQASVDEHSQLDVDAFRRPQPVKVSQHRCDVLVPRRSMNQSGGGVEHGLKSTELRRRKPSKCCVAIVETWRDQRLAMALFNNSYMLISLPLSFLRYYRSIRSMEIKGTCDLDLWDTVYHNWLVLAMIGLYCGSIKVIGRHRGRRTPPRSNKFEDPIRLTRSSATSPFDR